MRVLIEQTYDENETKFDILQRYFEGFNSKGLKRIFVFSKQNRFHTCPSKCIFDFRILPPFRLLKIQKNFIKNTNLGKNK